MKIIAFDGYVLSNGGYTAGLNDDQNIGGYGLTPNTLPRRAAAALMTGATINSRTQTVQFIEDGSSGLTIENAFQTLLGILDPTNDNPRTLTGELNDGTVVECQAIVINPNAAYAEDEVNVLPVTFFMVDPFWRVLTDTTTSVTATESTAVAIANNGKVRAYPWFKIDPVTQRTTDSSTVGWKYRRQVTITNNTTEDWRDQPICIDLGDTAAWVTAVKALANGDDVRVYYQGSGLNRTLTNFNTKRTLCHFLVSIKSGGSNTYDVVYGNPSAGTATTMSSRGGSRETYIAYDLEGDSGTLTSGSTTTATDSGAAWETDQWAGGFIGFTSGTGSVRYRRVASNTSTTITLNRALGTAVNNTTTYILWKSGIYVDSGRVTSRSGATITDNLHTIKWGVNQLAGATVTFIGGSTANPATKIVESNTADTITFTSGFGTMPTVGDTYQIERYGVWSYVVDTAITETDHRGMYRVNNFYSPAERTWPGELTPGGWGPDTYLANDDDYRQLRPQDIGSGGGHAINIFALLRASRRVRQKSLYKDEGAGDGMSIYSPFRFQGMYWDKKVKNINGVGQAIVAGKAPSGEDWAVIDAYTTTQATLTDVAAAYIDLDAYGNPSRLGCFVIPADEVEIPTTAATSDEVELRTNNILILYHDLDSFGGLASGIYSVGSETDVYDMSMVLRMGGGEESVKEPPYDLIRVGGSGHKLFMPLTHELWIRTDPSTDEPFAAVYSSSVYQYRCPWAVRPYHHENNIAGVDTGVISRDIMPIKPGNNLLTNPTFTTNTTGWTLTTTSGTVTWSRDATEFKDAAGSLKAALNDASIGKALSPSFATVVGQTYDVSFWWRTDDLSIDDLSFLGVSPFVIDGATSTVTNAYGITIYGGGYIASESIQDTWRSRGWSFTATDDSYQIGFNVKNTIGGASAIWLDAIVIGPPNLYISEDEMGEITVTTLVREGYS